jgi:hypothetical protein
LIQRAASRFVSIYLGLFCFASQFAGGLLLFPGGQFPALGTVWPMRDITNWLGTHVFHVTTLAYQGVSADTPFHWVQMAWLVVVSAIVTAIWTVRLKPDTTEAAHTDSLVSGFSRTFFRFALAAQMFYFGMAKVIPTQFPPPALVTLLKPVGNLSPDDLLWTFIGASTRIRCSPAGRRSSPASCWSSRRRRPSARSSRSPTCCRCSSSTCRTTSVSSRRRSIWC